MFDHPLSSPRSVLRGTTVYSHVVAADPSRPARNLVRYFNAPDGFLAAVADAGSQSQLDADAPRIVMDVIGSMSLKIRWPSELADIMTRAHETLVDKAPGATAACTVLYFRPDGVYEVSVGHSEAWAYPAGRCDRLSRRHERWFLGERRGSYEVRGPFDAHWPIVLGSDGLFRYMVPEQIVDVLAANPANPAAALAAGLVATKGQLRDDFAAVVCLPAIH